MSNTASGDDRSEESTRLDCSVNESTPRQSASRIRPSLPALDKPLNGRLWQNSVELNLAHPTQCVSSFGGAALRSCVDCELRFFSIRRSSLPLLAQLRHIPSLIRLQISTRLPSSLVHHAQPVLLALPAATARNHHADAS